MEMINVPSAIADKEKFVNQLQIVANTLDAQSVEIMAKFCLKNGNKSSELVKDLSTNFMTKKYF
jgi:hypothetical protein